MGAIAIMLAQGGSGTSRPVVTWNPADKSADITLSGSNLIATKVTSNGQAAVRATYGIDAAHPAGGYFEWVLAGSGGAANFAAVGLGSSSEPALSNFVGSSANSYGYAQDGSKYNNATGSAYGSSYTAGDVIGILLKNGKVYFRKNGTWQNSGDPNAETGFAYSGLSGVYYPAVSIYRFDTADFHRGTGRFKAADQTGSLPSGISAWGT